MLSRRLNNNPSICSVYFSFEKDLAHVRGSQISQNFFDSLPPNTFTPVYVSRSKTQFRETYQENASGGIFQQQVSVSMPRHSYERSQNIKKIISARYIFLELTDGKIIVVGRNDHQQNKKIECKYNANHSIAQFQFNCRSIFGAGYVELDGAGFPYQIPTQIP